MEVRYEIKRGGHGWYYMLYVGDEFNDCSTGFGSSPDDKSRCYDAAEKAKREVEGQLERLTVAD